VYLLNSIDELKSLYVTTYLGIAITNVFIKKRFDTGNEAVCTRAATIHNISYVIMSRH